jgi:hypothetical protein
MQALLFPPLTPIAVFRISAPTNLKPALGYFNFGVGKTRYAYNKVPKLT